jgi:hypothetical protein
MPAMVPDLPDRDGLHQPGCQQGPDMTMAEEPNVPLANIPVLEHPSGKA